MTSRQNSLRSVTNTQAHDASGTAANLFFVQSRSGMSTAS